MSYVETSPRQHNYDGEGIVHIARRGLRRVKPSLRKWLKRRSPIEPLIVHMKNDGRMNQNQLSGTEGDRMNALLCACGYNLRKLLAVFLFWLFYRILRKEVYIPNWGYGLLIFLRHISNHDYNSPRIRLYQGRLL